ncbi:tRNA (adenosine(37)-N6)-threonylcarbamoyltransferase complex ATPase subunit type 1 TsaE [Candidatus Daviesbacteria bacterium RIFCSPHIGHO2_01_FULL_44_29]|uniref:tRNA threonylcarbamoyladenosine biosynthesis protein TsaE n=1 Tax=Candidatus Daviesbacteria bacterium RIFCSPHIGHO2_02_FULL_43_12 TaxID=1797776 RepID=A0A1F5KKC0_9BACT|nr:MAG: tRNA (adenosine(37)-N6)-threonylcarbamoyltransferase complex ATPase subunit type 1 TsaE [Candidatus Daviesbacteria bacterium RIFCSPHIGHO2_01_FULL_44_29]OGE40763.1 MAG: tRNA (adenosine(37)-N6)-threonylcarbamoyltransferase complex ATPase subunit type 1 TsaE [Candidatus Daviesbacteria bacterium RIFCSPHIGHO2_12_FULL_47_45]OGE41387.1 MAG: tRNA (adenosine(37)-N6)-threonylcarbamoyltransferase complex ATPase subunit type 1 TsaE [Candidatus Daviesbacteria bacterium RIFCSPHIGHO2_02_FULL_43_12]OGE6
MKVTTHSAEATKQFAKELAQKYIGQGILITLEGELGVGKTTFAQGFAAGLDITQKILSPTFVITRQYLLNATQQTFYHCDLYRFDTGFDTINTGISELLANSKDIILIEWADRLGDRVPSRAISVTLRRLSENKHEITLTTDD